MLPISGGAVRTILQWLAFVYLFCYLQFEHELSHGLPVVTLLAIRGRQAGQSGMQGNGNWLPYAFQLSTLYL